MLKERKKRIVFFFIFLYQNLLSKPNDKIMGKGPNVGTFIGVTTLLTFCSNYISWTCYIYLPLGCAL